MRRAGRPAPPFALLVLLCLVPGSGALAQETAQERAPDRVQEGVRQGATQEAAPRADREAPRDAPPSEAAERSEEHGLVLRDRVLAVVDEYPILSSDVDRAIALGLAQRQPEEGEDAFRRRVLDSLIDQRVRLHEVTRFGIEQVPVESIEEQVQVIQDRFPSEEAFRRQLAEVGLNLEGLRQLVAQRLAVWVYFEEFLGPRVFVSLEDIRRYYEEVLAPGVREAGEEPPPIETVREDIRRVLKERRLNEAIDDRTEELRREADIQNYFDRESRELPPVVLELGPEPEPTSG
ncbi:MAG: hypothetical protein ACLF0P_08360 [Thermoanaerobaculia bacterium]